MSSTYHIGDRVRVIIRAFDLEEWHDEGTVTDVCPIFENGVECHFQYRLAGLLSLYTEAHLYPLN